MTTNGETYQSLRARLDARLKEHADSCAFREARAYQTGRGRGLWIGYLCGIATMAALLLVAHTILFPGFF